ncbi:MAG TPA: outer membrane lipoprotein carrier protein LolA [Terracidiphilus sp.]
MSAAADAAEKLPALKGHGFSRAGTDSRSVTASAAAGFSSEISQNQTRLFPARPRGVCLFLVGLCCAVMLSALAHGAPDSKAPSAKELAQRVDRHYNSLHSLKCGFTENFQGLGMDRTESGTLLLLKPGRMRWDYSSPAGKIFLLDGKYAWSYTKGDAQAERIPAKDLNDLRSPLRYFLGHAELGREMKDLKATPGANGQFTLTGVPKGMESRVSRLTLTVTPDGVIHGMTIEETDSAVTRFTFTNQQPNAPMPASSFRFTPPPGVQVQDAMPPI